MRTKRRKMNRPHDMLAPLAPLPFAVVLIVGGRERMFSRYASRADAELVLRRMKRRGFDCRLADEGPTDEAA
jgi:hypothetical protein